MKLSVTSWSFTALTLAEACGVSKALGLGAIDLGLLHGPALDRQAVLDDPDAVAADFAAHGMACSNLYWLFGDGLEPRALTKPEALADNLADFQTVARFAKTLGAPTIFVLPGVTEPGVDPATLIERSATALRELLPIARDAGVALTIEPHIGGILPDPDTTLRLLDKVPGLGLALDYSHFVTMGVLQSQIDALLPHAMHMHLRQARPGHLQTKWGQGTIDFGAIFERLRAQGYDGYLALEYVHQDYVETLYDDVLTETVRMRDEARRFGVAG